MRKRIGWLCLWMLFLAAGWAGLASPAPPTEDIEYQSSLGDILPARLYLPTVGQPPYPVVLCIHSFWQAGVSAEPQAQEFARNGFLAVSPPLAPYSAMAGRKRDIADFVSDLDGLCKTLRYRKDVRPDAIFALGHSMGADLACALGIQDASIRGVIALGFPVQADPDAPHNLLISVGAWDELHPLTEMQDALSKATRPDQLNGTARQLYVQATADHFMEIFDGDIIVWALEWMNGILGRPTPAPHIRMLSDTISTTLLVSGAVGAGVVLLASVGRLYVAVGMLTVLLLGALYRTDPRPIWHLLILGVAAATVLAPSIRGARRMAVDAMTLWLVLAAVYLVNSVPALRACGPRSLLFLLYAPPTHLRDAFMQAEGLFLHRAAHTTGISPALMAVLLVELILPGRMGWAAEEAWLALVDRIQGMDLAIKAGVGRPQAIVLVLLLAGAVLAWRQTLAAGYALGGADALRLAWSLLRFFVLPLCLFGFLVRSRPYRRLTAEMPPRVARGADTAGGAPPGPAARVPTAG